MIQNNLIKIKFEDSCIEKKFDLDLNIDSVKLFFKELINENFTYLKDTKSLIVILYKDIIIYIKYFIEDKRIKKNFINNFNFINDFLLPTTLNFDINNLVIIKENYNNFNVVDNVSIIENEIFNNATKYFCIANVINYTDSENIINQLIEKIINKDDDNDDLLYNLTCQNGLILRYIKESHKTDELELLACKNNPESYYYVRKSTQYNVNFIYNFLPELNSVHDDPCIYISLLRELPNELLNDKILLFNIINKAHEWKFKWIPDTFLLLFLEIDNKELLIKFIQNKTDIYEINIIKHINKNFFQDKYFLIEFINNTKVKIEDLEFLLSINNTCLQDQDIFSALENKI